MPSADVNFPSLRWATTAALGSENYWAGQSPLRWAPETTALGNQRWAGQLGAYEALTADATGANHALVAQLRNDALVAQHRWRFVRV